MQTIEQILESRRKFHKKPDEQDLKRLPYRDAYVYGRLSSTKQVRDSKESIREIGRLLELAIQDGYTTSLSPDDITLKLDRITYDPAAEKLWSDGEVTVDVRDLGISGQVSGEERQGLFNLQREVREATVLFIHIAMVFLFS
jgi:hypothetical protein